MSELKLIVIGIILGSITFLINYLIKNWTQAKVLVMNKRGSYYIQLSEFSIEEQQSIQNVLDNFNKIDYSSDVIVKTKKIIKKFLKQYRKSNKKLFNCILSKVNGTRIRCSVEVKQIEKTFIKLGILDFVDHIERRNFERFTLNEKSIIKVDGTVINAIIEDISEKSIKVLTESNIEINSKVIVFIDTVKILAQVVRTDKNYSMNTYSLSIISINEKDESDFNKFLRELRRIDSSIKKDDFFIKL